MLRTSKASGCSCSSAIGQSRSGGGATADQPARGKQAALRAGASSRARPCRPQSARLPAHTGGPSSRGVGGARARRVRRAPGRSRRAAWRTRQRPGHRGQHDHRRTPRAGVDRLLRQRSPICTYASRWLTPIRSPHWSRGRHRVPRVADGAARTELPPGRDRPAGGGRRSSRRPMPGHNGSARLGQRSSRGPRSSSGSRAPAPATC